jgi:ribonuclease J
MNNSRIEPNQNNGGSNFNLNNSNGGFSQNNQQNTIRSFRSPAKFFRSTGLENLNQTASELSTGGFRSNPGNYSGGSGGGYNSMGNSNTPVTQSISTTNQRTNSRFNNNFNSSQSPSSNNRSQASRGRQTKQLPKKTSARASEKPQYVAKTEFRNDYVDNGLNQPKIGSITAKSNPLSSGNGNNRGIDGGKQKEINQIRRGNIANPNLNPALNSGPVLKTNSASVFPNGPIVKIIPLGGVSEVGMNMTAFECGDDIVIVDCGMGFGGGEKFPGVDYIIPDTAYLEENRHRIRGLIYTHAHLDHIGASPYILPRIGQVPIFAMPLTLALLKNRLEEFGLAEKITAQLIQLDQSLTLGRFRFQFFRLNHSIPDVVGLDIQTPMGRIVYCTDWKFDNTPFDGQISDYGKLGKIGDEGVRLLLTDSLGILKPGSQVSEMVIKSTIIKIFEQCKYRVLVTSFSTTISRLQFTVDACVKYNRRLALAGRSMVTNFRTCVQMGYIKVPENLIIDIAEIDRLAPENVCILSTGSQGEDMSALSTMARDEHRLIKLQGGDSVIFTSKPIPGNEDAVADLIAKLSRKGVTVYQNREFDLHVSGHASQEDLKLLMALTKPDYLQPIHGDHFMLKKTGELGASMGIKFDHCLVGENGRITELRPDKVVLTEDFVTDKYILVDGTGVGSVSEAVLQERRQMATQGSVTLVILINKKKELVAGPEIISRGFVYMKSATDLFDEIKEVVKTNFNKFDIEPHSATYFTDLRGQIKTLVSHFISKKTEKDPMVIPVVVQM